MRVAISLVTLWLVFVCARPAYAYIDPGSGGMMIQLLLGGVAGVAVLVRLYWQRFLTLLRIRKPGADAP